MSYHGGAPPWVYKNQIASQQSDYNSQIRRLEMKIEELEKEKSDLKLKILMLEKENAELKLKIA